MYKDKLLVWVLLLSVVIVNAVTVKRKTYNCSSEGTCIQGSKFISTGRSLSSCLLTCGKGNLWPYPSGKVTIQDSIVPLSTISEDYSQASCQKTLTLAVIEFKSSLPVVNHNADGSPLSIIFVVKGGQDQQIRLDTDESYSLSITAQANIVTATITAATYFGARHGLETLSQLIGLDNINSPARLVIASNVQIADKPAFPYRGLLVDTGRHFLPISSLKKMIRALGYNKMNTLHLHLSDTASFPVEMTKRPEVTEGGAFDPDSVYSVQDIKDLVKFATVYGVRVIPEIDAPGHANEGWKFGPEKGLGDLVLCTEGWANKALEPPSGQMNIANDHVYEVLSDIYEDIVEMFSTDLYHLGGDEVIVGNDATWASCWNNTKEGAPIIKYLSDKGLPRNSPESFYKLWQNFTVKAVNSVKKAYTTSGKNLDKIIQWGGASAPSPIVYNLIDRDDVVSVLDPKDVIIEVWDVVKGSIVPTLLKKGYEVIMAHTDYVYLDCGSSGWAHAGGFWCNPYHEWYKIYDYIPDAIEAWGLKNTNGILGSETAMWGELVDATNLEQKVWPRTSALGERLWSNPSTGWYEADYRMQHHRLRLVQRGINAEALQPTWCSQNGGTCTINSGKPVDKEVYRRHY